MPRPPTQAVAVEELLARDCQNRAQSEDGSCGIAVRACSAKVLECVRQWLLEADLAEARGVLYDVRDQRPELFEGIAAQIIADRTVRMDDVPASPLEAAAVYSVDDEAMLRRDAEAAAAELPIVQFSTRTYYCEEEQGEVVIDVMRLGPQNEHSEVQYATEDVTAFAGFRYEQAVGKLMFEPEETQKQIRVPLLYSRDWEPTTEFAVRLLRDPAPENCVLGRYWHKARVRIIDGGAFPDARFRQLVRRTDFSNIPKWSLFYYYILLNWRNPVVQKGTLKMLALGVVHNIYFLLKQLVKVYLVDIIVKQGDDGLGSLLLLAGLVLIPFGILHIFDFLRTTWKVGGASRMMLQTALVRKVMNYGEEARQHIHHGDIIMAITRDVNCLVHEGYVGVVACVESMGLVLAALFFQFSAPMLFRIEFNLFPIVTCLIIPVFLFGFLPLRQNITTHCISEKNKKQDVFAAQVDRMVTLYRIIADYNRRLLFVNRCGNCINEYNDAWVEADKVLVNNTYFAPWLTAFGIATYTVIGGLQAARGGIGVGMLLANISIIRAIGLAMGDIYSKLNEIEGAFPALENITRLLNLPIDLPERMAMSQHWRERTETLRHLLNKERRSTGDIVLPIDRMTILVNDLKFDFQRNSATMGDGDGDFFINTRGRLEVRQGQLVALVGPHGQGKTTLLHILGGVHLPKAGDHIFVPSHLRVLHISAEPLFFRSSLLDNLIFGVSDSCEEDGQLSRVVKICSRLGLPESVLALLQLDVEMGHTPWYELLPYSQRCLLCIARALIANPELMCIQKPTTPFDDRSSLVILDSLRDFCKNKGLELEESARHMRRPRTCIMTCSKLLGVQMSDSVFHISRKDGVKPIEKDQVRNDMVS